ncbi:SIMPL domain-containing protein [Nonomuraea sp. NPDC005501]|uniref:SIMPL domain-containing protein n=1 Tax=Nonomuraea sp. NPDC005501 TaxID=3156884 RepID=UPI0033BAB526
MIKLSAVVASATFVLLGAQAVPALASAGPKPESPSLARPATQHASRPAGHVSHGAAARTPRPASPGPSSRASSRPSPHALGSPGVSSRTAPHVSGSLGVSSRTASHVSRSSGVSSRTAGTWPGEPAQLTVVGRGTVQAPPDVMRLSVGVEVRRDRAAAAFSAAKATRARLAAAVQGAGISMNDLRTENLTLGAEYKDGAQVVGYRASQGVEVLLRDLSRADAVIDAVAAVGDEVQINGVTFEISKGETLVQQARAAAYRDALAKARQLAALAGRHVGRVVRMDEQAEAPTRQYAMADGAFVSPGESSVSVIVNVVYELI